MTTRSTTRQPSAGESVDAPALQLEQLSDRQRQGRSCCWCSGTPDLRFPVPILRTVGVRLYACLPCAALYEVAEGDQ